jgi:signal transduction histidine kinase
MPDERIDALRQALRRQPGPAVGPLLGHLDALERELAATAVIESRLQEITDSLYALASLDFSKTPRVSDDGSLIDAAAACVMMLAEELQAHLEERQRAAEKLVQSEKMAAIGQLAAGVAHEVNNPLGVILMFAEGIQKRLGASDTKLEKPVAAIIREATRCKTLVERLLASARNNQTREPLDLRQVLQGASQLLEVRAKSQQTELTLELAAAVPQVLGNRSQLEQVIINLGVNALDALEKGGHVKLRVVSADTGHVALQVEDDGPGISAAVRARMFEPFFTTKSAGKGTGLGLSLSWDIVQRHGGTVDVNSEPGRGTTMSVRLPVLQRAA